MAILRFHQDLCNFNFKTRFEGKDKNNKTVMIRLAEGTDEVIEKNQEQGLNQRPFKTGYPNKMVDGEWVYETEIHDEAVLAMLKHTRHFKNGKIKEYDPVAQNKVALQKTKHALSVINEVTKLSDNNEKLQLGVARLGAKKAFAYAQNDDYDGLNIELIEDAQNNPNEVEELLKDKSKSDIMNLALAFAKGVIKETDSSTKVRFADNDAEIITVKTGVTPFLALVDYCKTDDGLETKQMIYKLLESSIKKSVTAKVPAK